jgi:hypothetical protein
MRHAALHPLPHTMVPMGTDYDDDQEGIRFDDPTLCIRVEDSQLQNNQFLVHYLRDLIHALKVTQQVRNRVTTA